MEAHAYRTCKTRCPLIWLQIKRIWWNYFQVLKSWNYGLLKTSNVCLVIRQKKTVQTYISKMFSVEKYCELVWFQYLDRVAWLFFTITLFTYMYNIYIFLYENFPQIFYFWSLNFLVWRMFRRGCVGVVTYFRNLWQKTHCFLKLWPIRRCQIYA